MPAAKRAADFLGWLSLGLGVPQVVMPRRVARSIGVRDDRKARAWMRVVGGVLVAYALATAALTRRSGDGSEEEEAPHAKAAITVAGDPEQVQRTWLDRYAGDGIGLVRFVPAPGGRGTEVHVDADSSMESVKEELRRFKQLLETGEEVRS